MWKCVSRVEQVGDGATIWHIKLTLNEPGRAADAAITIIADECPYIEGEEYKFIPLRTVVEHAPGSDEWSGQLAAAREEATRNQLANAAMDLQPRGSRKRGA